MASAPIEILYTGVSLLLIIFSGWLCVELHVFPDQRQTAQLFAKFLFNIAIPCLVFRALANTDFTSLSWEFVLVFLLLRVIVGFTLWITELLLPKKLIRVREMEDDFLGSFLTDFIATTWINTIVFGIPMLQSLYGEAVKILNVLAAISSLFFQLPLMLVLFEIRKMKKLGGTRETKDEERPEHEPGPGEEEEELSKIKIQEGENSAFQPVLRILLALVTNMPLMGILLGLAWSLIVNTAISLKELPRIMSDVTDLLGSTVQPLAAFSIGIFMRKKELWAFRYTLRNLVYIFAKMLLLPMLCIPLVLIWPSLQGIEGRSAVLIASLPVAVASFAIGEVYFEEEVSVVLFSSQLIIGTLLMTPVFIGWDSVMTALNLFGEIPPDAVYKPTV